MWFWQKLKCTTKSKFSSIYFSVCLPAFILSIIQYVWYLEFRIHSLMLKNCLSKYFLVLLAPTCWLYGNSCFWTNVFQMSVWFLTLMATIERVILVPIRNICFLVLFLYEEKFIWLPGRINNEKRRKLPSKDEKTRAQREQLWAYILKSKR